MATEMHGVRLLVGLLVGCMVLECCLVWVQQRIDSQIGMKSVQFFKKHVPIRADFNLRQFAHLFSSICEILEMFAEASRNLKNLGCVFFLCQGGLPHIDFMLGYSLIQ